MRVHIGDARRLVPFRSSLTMPDRRLHTLARGLTPTEPARFARPLLRVPHRRFFASRHWRGTPPAGMFKRDGFSRVLSS